MTKLKDFIHKYQEQLSRK